MHLLLPGTIWALACGGVFATPMTGNPVVDLGYEIYKGTRNDTLGLNIFRGIRYAAPPTGKLRWQAPQAPKRNRSSVKKADEFPPRCPQAPSVLYFTEPPGLGYAGDEDCLFLNVYAPIGTKKLPVLIWIHGGGYGAGDGTYDPVALQKANDNGFVAVILQYRLGAFGWLSSKEVHRNGVVNAGLLDQRFGFQWVQKNIAKFGGDPEAVTISGQSAGGGSVMLHAMAYDGRDPERLFINLIPSSPYLPQQYDYDGKMPTDFFERFVRAAGCSSKQQDVFGCLVKKDSAVLQKANYDITESARYGMWAFVPVTDRMIVKRRPSQQLLPGQRLNGQRLLTSSTANEGPFFTPRDVSSHGKFANYIHTLLPLLSDAQRRRVLQVYAPLTTKKFQTPFSTTGTSSPTALEMSNYAVGPQQRAYNLNAEVTFSCIAYWLAEAFSGSGRTSWKYEYSLPPAFHASDLFGNGWLTDPTLNIPEDFAQKFRKSWGNFIIHNDPGWKPWTLDKPQMQNFNVTGGFPVRNYTIANLRVSQTYGDDVKATVGLVDARSWEGGRGKRCDFWRSVAKDIPA